MYSKLILWGVFTLAVVQPTTFAQAGSDSGKNHRCLRIRAKLMTVRVAEGCTSPVDFCAEGVITGDGWIHGKTKGIVLGLVPSVGLPGIEPETTLSYAGDRTIVTPHGTLTLRFTGVFDTARGEFSELERVTEGTGELMGAAGTIYLTGRSSADGTSFEGDITGVICRADSAKEQ